MYLSKQLKNTDHTILLPRSINDHYETKIHHFENKLIKELKYIRFVCLCVSVQSDIKLAPGIKICFSKPPYKNLINYQY